MVKTEKSIKNYNINESPEIFDLLRCPYCLSKIKPEEYGAICQNCEEKFFYDTNGKLDFRLKKPKKVSLGFELGNSLSEGYQNSFKIKKDKGYRLNDRLKSRMSKDVQRELFSYFPKRTDNNLVVLDIGCENAIYREPCEYLGFTYFGTDIISSSTLSFLSDAHALPIANDYFDLVLAINLIEHLKYPFVAIKEISRVLKPGGIFIGVVSFLEPFHMQSYYHCTHLGIYNLLDFGGFEIKSISPSHNWDVFKAFATMGFIPKAPKFIIDVLFLPIRIFYELWWGAGIFIKTSNVKRRLNRIFTKAGSFTFVTQKGSFVKT